MKTSDNGSSGQGIGAQAASARSCSPTTTLRHSSHHPRASSRALSLFSVAFCVVQMLVVKASNQSETQIVRAGSALSVRTLPHPASFHAYSDFLDLEETGFSAALIEAASVWGPAWAPVSCSMRPGAALKGRARGPSAFLFQRWSLVSLASRTALRVVIDWTKSCGLACPRYPSYSAPA